jgi:hypothetical protein
MRILSLNPFMADILPLPSKGTEMLQTEKEHREAAAHLCTEMRCLRQAGPISEGPICRDEMPKHRDEKQRLALPLRCYKQAYRDAA